MGLKGEKVGTIRVVDLMDIEEDRYLLVREIDPNWVRRLEEPWERCEVSEPPKVYEARGKYYPITGNHRIAAARRALGVGGEIRVEVMDGLSPSEMLKMAVSDNARHPKPFTDAERSALYFRLTREEGWSQDEALKALGMAPSRAERIDDPSPETGRPAVPVAAWKPPPKASTEVESVYRIKQFSEWMARVVVTERVGFELAALREAISARLS